MVDIEELLKSEKVNKRLEEVMLKTVVANLTDAQVAEFQEALKGGNENLENKIAAITARVPGLAFLIESAVAQELEKIKAALSA